MLYCFGSGGAVKTQTRIRLKHAERQAEGYLELGLYQQALDVLTRYARRCGAEGDLSSHALYLWGEALRSLGRFEEALEPLGRAARLAPGDVHVRLALGWCHKRTLRIDLAVQELEKALHFGANEALVHYNLACYLSLAGQKRRALKSLARALALDPGYRTLIDDEPDFDPLRGDPDFLALTSTTAGR
jgi:Flp pilus assembly protein TadD